MNGIISIIIPTYNRADNLCTAINSVVNQSNVNWELIIVDDGSTDATKEVISKYLLDERIQYWFQENSGVSVARNKGVQLSNGHYIIFLDSDDYFLPGLISELYSKNYTAYDIICWQILKKLDGKLSVCKPTKLEKIYNNITASFLAGSICYNKQVFIEAGGFDSHMSFGENYELGMRISDRNDLKIKIIDQQLSTYTVNSKFRESNSYRNKLKSYKQLYKKHKHKYLKDPYAHSQINYFLGYIHEKLDMKEDAEKFYNTSFSINPLNYKAFLKSLYFLIK